MTYIEFFDKTDAENICACLTFTPDRVIFIGDNGDLMKKHIAWYSRVFVDRNQNIEFLYRSVSKSNLEGAVNLLTELVQTYDDCVFGISGGDELLMLALGIVYEQNRDRNIQIHRFNIRNSTVSDCDKDGNTIYSHEPKLSVEEQIRIYGGDVIYGDADGEDTYRWDLNEEFVADIERIWQCCRGNVRYWNKQIGYFETMKELAEKSEDGLTLAVRRSVLEAHLARKKIKFKPARGIISYLLKHGLLTWYDDTDDRFITVSFKDLQVKRCLTKAGQALEMKMYLAVRAARNNGVPAYDDAMNGVVIDWDGEPHDEETEHIYDTENEMDILLMHGIVPVFVSCKNGIVTSDELHKLDVVARRFGGQYAKKVLIATSIPADDEDDQGAYLRQRARDMRIKLVEGVQHMTDQELEKKLRNLWNN